MDELSKLVYMTRVIFSSKSRLDFGHPQRDAATMGSPLGLFTKYRTLGTTQLHLIATFKACMGAFRKFNRSQLARTLLEP